MSRQGKLVKNTFVLGIGMILPKFATLVTLPILTACLTKEEYGTYDLVIVLVSMLLPATTLQIQTAAFRFLIDVRDNREKTDAIITNIFAFIIPTAIISLIVMVFLIPGTFWQKFFICGYFFVDIIVNATRQIARGLSRNMDFSISALLSAVGKLIFTVVFVWWLGFSLTGALAALLFAATASFVVLAYRIKLFSHIHFNLISKTELKEMLAYSWPMVPNSLAIWVMNLSDRLVLVAFLGPAANAVYAVANKIPNMLTLAQNTYTMAWQENASIASKDEDSTEYYTRMFHATFNLMAGALGLLICATPLLFFLLIRGDYNEAFNHMPLLFLAMFFFSMCSFLGGIYVAHKATKSVGITTILAAVCNLAIDFALVNVIGIYAASISTLVSFMFLFIYRMINVRKYEKLKYNIPHIVFVILILAVESTLCFFQNPILNIVNIVFGVTVFIVLNKALTMSIFRRVKNLISRKKKK